MQKLETLSPEQIKERAPQVYTDKPYDQVSDKYVFLPTHRIVDDMAKLGWQVSDAKTMKTKNPIQKKYGKHMVVFYNPDIFIKDDEGGIEAYPQILIQNNARGWGKLKFSVGIFRMICSNGLIIRSKDLGEFSLRHFGYTFEDLQNLVQSVVDNLPRMVEKINDFSQKEMTPDEQRSFAYKAIQARFGEERLVEDYEVNQVLVSARPQDAGSSLWVTLNRVQEHLVRGGFTMIGADKKERKVRKIVNIQADVALNEKLFELAEEYC
jgi:hypothetical protein